MKTSLEILVALWTLCDDAVWCAVAVNSIDEGTCMSGIGGTKWRRLDFVSLYSMCLLSFSTQLLRICDSYVVLSTMGSAIDGHTIMP